MLHIFLHVLLAIQLAAHGLHDIGQIGQLVIAGCWRHRFFAFGHANGVITQAVDFARKAPSK